MFDKTFVFPSSDEVVPFEEVFLDDSYCCLVACFFARFFQGLMVSHFSAFSFLWDNDGRLLTYSSSASLSIVVRRNAGGDWVMLWSKSAWLDESFVMLSVFPPMLDSFELSFQGLLPLCFSSAWTSFSIVFFSARSVALLTLAWVVSADT